LFVPRPNSNFMKRTFHYSGTILWNSLPPNLKLIQDIDLFKKKYTDYLMSKQNNEWLYSLYQGFILDYIQSNSDISLWICMYCLKLYLLYLIIIVLRATEKISLLLLTVLPSWNKVITYLLTWATERNDNSISADVTDDAFHNVQTDACFSYFQTIVSCFWRFILQDKHNIRTLSLSIEFNLHSLTILFRPPNTFKLFGFQIFRYWAYLLNVISETRPVH
jgi:hypothetical protein